MARLAKAEAYVISSGSRSSQNGNDAVHVRGSLACKERMQPKHQDIGPSVGSISGAKGSHGKRAGSKASMELTATLVKEVQQLGKGRSPLALTQGNIVRAAASSKGEMACGSGSLGTVLAAAQTPRRVLHSTSLSYKGFVLDLERALEETQGEKEDRVSDASSDGLSDFVVSDCASEEELRRPPRSARKPSAGTRKRLFRRDQLPSRNIDRDRSIQVNSPTKEVAKPPSTLSRHRLVENIAQESMDEELRSVAISYVSSASYWIPS